MRKIVISAFMVTGLLFNSHAFAKNTQKFDSSITADVESVKVEVVMSEDLAWRANNLPKSLRDRNGAFSFNDGFVGNGFYGERDLERLTERLYSKIDARLAKAGISVSDNATQTLRITLEDARPNRPTFNQLSKKPQLSHQSIALGGATFKAELLSSTGESLGEISYAWYENDIRDAAYSGTWSDANRAIDRFARKTSKSLE